MGLMAPERKRPLPVYPQVVGIVTSPRGSVIHDMLRTLRRRYPLAKVMVAGVPVEGPGAADAMVDGLAKVVFAGAELVLLGRGGGSFEDLMPFNDRRLARTIAACPVPVVTGIGHEPDTTIADLVADVRASTPTAAAEAVAPTRKETDGRLESLGQRLGRGMELKLTGAARSVERIAALSLFREPERLFDTEALALDDLSDRLGRALPDTLRENRHRVGLLGEALTRMLPGALDRPAGQVSTARARLVARGTTLTDRFAAPVLRDRGRLHSAGERMTDHFRRSVAVNAARLHDLSPLTVIGRGFSIARTDEGAVVRSVDQVAPGASLMVAVGDGEIDCTVDRCRRIDAAVEDWRE